MAASITPTAWPTDPWANICRYISHACSWLCSHVCGALYDQESRLIADSAIATRDDAIEEANRFSVEVERLKAKLAQAEGTEPW